MTFKEYKKICRDVAWELGIRPRQAIRIVNRLIARGVRPVDVVDVVADGMTVAEYKTEYASIL